jgi:SHS2 domain-containing protein
MSVGAAMKKYEFKDHTADIIARAYGDSLEEAFASAATAMFDIITGGADIGTSERRELQAESIDTEGLLVGFLSELIVLHETEDIVLGEFDVTIDGNRLTAVCRGDRFDLEKHSEGTPVKGVSYHMMEIDSGGDGEPAHVQVLFDI